MRISEERYEAICSNCGHVFYAGKSLGQELGMEDWGCGSCPKCRAFLNLTYDKKSNKMKTMLWDKYIRIRKSKELNQRKYLKRVKNRKELFAKRKHKYGK